MCVSAVICVLRSVFDVLCYVLCVAGVLHVLCELCVMCVM